MCENGHRWTTRETSEFYGRYSKQERPPTTQVIKLLAGFIESIIEIIPVALLAEMVASQNNIDTLPATSQNHNDSEPEKPESKTTTTNEPN